MEGQRQSVQASEGVDAFGLEIQDQGLLKRNGDFYGCRLVHAITDLREIYEERRFTRYMWPEITLRCEKYLEVF
jgi:hypothetical protein